VAHQVLIVVTEEAAGETIDVNGDAVLGREGEGCPELGDDPKLSRRHARLARDAGGAIVVEDLGSTNGTFVNDTRIEGIAPLRPGDRVRFGNTVWQLTDADSRGV
jgi:pSer/pThr/pTyr-binding forkhead associated (FHA) protein